MPFGLVKQSKRRDGKNVFEYGFKKIDMDLARGEWEVLCRKHLIKNAGRAFPPAPPKIDLFIPRVTVLDREAALEKHNDGSPIEIVNKTNGNFQIIVKSAVVSRKKDRIDLGTNREIED